MAAAFVLADGHWRLVLVAAAGLSDFVDGLLARLLNARSRTGQWLDPVGDKAFVVVALVTLVVDDSVEPWQAGFILLRDVSVLVSFSWLAIQKRWDALPRMKPRFPGKAATAVFYTWFLAVVSWPQAQLTQYVFVIAACASMIAAVDYLLLFVAALRAQRSDELPPNQPPLT